MKNYPSTQETPPKLTEPNLPNKSPLLANHSWLLVVGVGALSIAIASLALFSLTTTGRVQTDPTKQTTIATQEQTTPTKSKSNSSPNWLLTIFLLGAGVGSAVTIYKLLPHLPTISKRRLSRRQQRRLLRQGDIAPEAMTTETNFLEIVPPLPEDQPAMPDLMNNAPIITVLPPEETQTNYLGGESLAEMMDIRKHLSLSTILQDFKHPD